jgi:hypothetical protein
MGHRAVIRVDLEIQSVTMELAADKENVTLKNRLEDLLKIRAALLAEIESESRKRLDQLGE